MLSLNKCVVGLLFLLTQVIVGVQLADKLAIGGHYLGVFNTFNANGAQFDFATNIDISYQVNDTVSTVVQLQGGNGGGRLGFAGAEAVVTDIAVIIDNVYRSTQLTLGSFDTPFGYETNLLTNNADATKSVFILNHLTYAALAGPVGTLNTLGAKLDGSLGDYLDIVAVVSNGTAESAENSSNTFETLLQISHQLDWQPILKMQHLRLTATVVQSNDALDDLTVANTSFGADFSASLYEVMYDVYNDVRVLGHVGTLTYSDRDDSTQDVVDVSMIGITGRQQKLQWGARLSMYNPTGSTVSSTSSVIATPGLSSTASIAADITRFQLAISYEYATDTQFLVEFINDNYSSGTDISGIITAVNVAF